MSKFLSALSAGLVMTLAASPAWAPRGPQWKQSPTTASATATPPAPPASVGRCRIDRALRERCAKEWDQCIVTAVKGVNPCPGRWRTCCTPPRSDAITIKQKLSD